MVVAVQAGTPFTSARTFPAVPAEVVARAEEPLPYGMAPDWMAAQPVPPFETGRTPVTSLARLMRAVATAPAVAFRKPVTFEKVNEFDATRFVVEAVPLTARAPLKVEVAVVEVALKAGAVVVPYEVMPFRKSALPMTSRILPVVDVAEPPRMTT